MLPRTKAQFRRRNSALFGSLAAAVILSIQLAAQKPQVTDKQVLPILERCFQCHGEAIQMSKLDLRTREGMLKGGEKGPSVVPGNATASALYKRITGQQQPLMPMPPVPALSAKEIALVKDWIDQGAQWTSTPTSAPAPAPPSTSASGYKEKQFTDKDRQWWAFQKPVRHHGSADNATQRWSRNPIDAFVRDMLTKKGLEPAPEADRRTLIRRAYLDLMGLLPPPAEVEEFVKDPSPKPTRSWSTGCWPRRITASAGGATGWTWPATPTAPASSSTSLWRTPGVIAIT